MALLIAGGLLFVGGLFPISLVFILFGLALFVWGAALQEKHKRNEIHAGHEGQKIVASVDLEQDTAEQIAFKIQANISVNRDGTVSVEQVSKELGTATESVTQAMQILEERGLITRQEGDHGTGWHVTNSASRQVCEYCRSTLPTFSQTHKCPSCGAPIPSSKSKG